MSDPHGALDLILVRVANNILSLKNTPHDLGAQYPQACRTSYNIGYLDALREAAALVTGEAMETFKKGSA